MRLLMLLGSFRVFEHNLHSLQMRSDRSILKLNLKKVVFTNLSLICSSAGVSKLESPARFLEVFAEKENLIKAFCRKA